MSYFERDKEGGVRILRVPYINNAAKLRKNDEVICTSLIYAQLIFKTKTFESPKSLKIKFKLQQLLDFFCFV